MGNHVEGVGFIAQFFAQFGGNVVPDNALAGQFVDDDLLTLGIVPAFEEVFEGGVLFLHGFAGVVGQFFGNEFAAGIQVLHTAAGNAELHVIHQKLDARAIAAVIIAVVIAVSTTG